MKKVLFVVLTLLAWGFSFGQEIIKLDNVEAATEKDGWVGNLNVSSFTRLEDAKFVISPRHVDPNISGRITQLKFYYHPYQEYNTTSFTLKIFEGVQLEEYNHSLDLYYYSSCGEEVYSQDFTAAGDGWFTVDLDVPYQIPEGEFWIGAEMHGMGTLAFGNENNAVLGDYYYTEMYEYNWYWKPTYFFNSMYDYILYSSGLAVYVEEDNACLPPTDLVGEYTWNGEDDFGVSLSWKAPQNSSPVHYNVYRLWEQSCPAVIAEPTSASYFDDVVVPGMTYIYEVTAVYADGCESEPVTTQVLVTSTDEHEVASTIVYPNPSSGVVNVVTDGSQTVEIFDLTGRLVLSEKVNGQISFDLVSGLYFVKVGGMVQKLVVK